MLDFDRNTKQKRSKQINKMFLRSKDPSSFKGKKKLQKANQQECKIIENNSKHFWVEVQKFQKGNTHL